MGKTRFVKQRDGLLYKVVDGEIVDDGITPAISNDEAVALIPHRSFDKAHLSLFVGRRGNGKTYAMQRYIERLEFRAFAVDWFDDFASYPLFPTYEHAFAYLNRGGPRLARINPSIGDESIEHSQEIFQFLTDYRVPRDFLFVTDEITLMSNRVASKALKTLILQGRRMGIKFLVGCQRIGYVPDVMLSETTELIVFNTVRPRDIEVLTEWTSPFVARNAPYLERGQCFFQSL